jgi:hypothetical protein
MVEESSTSVDDDLGAVENSDVELLRVASVCERRGFVAGQEGDYKLRGKLQ